MSEQTKNNIIDWIVAILGVTAASLVAFKAPQPYLWFAFPMYVVSASLALYMNYKRRIWPMMVLFGFYIIIDSIGVIRWWPF